MIVRAARALLIVLVASFAAALPTQAAEPSTCDPDNDVVVTVDPGALDGEFTTLCVPDADGRSALDLLQATGLPTENTAGGSPMLCRIDGHPNQSLETCGSELSGDGYWAFYVAEIGGEWGYADVGPSEYEASGGDFLTFEYTPLSESNPGVPDLVTNEEVFRTTAVAPGQVTGDEPDPQDGELAGDDATVSWQLGAALLVVVVLVAAAVLVGRRRGRR